ncbi:type 1 glutamine amidotransferase [Thalassovita sp.]|jgi:GMP synthase (glutamine-hydrolysing)|uniref:type 1 glutamine amidotransferase n=1 Tax=Thalassovita sp. TaxID=1979401 RepID=UPI003B593974
MKLGLLQTGHLPDEMLETTGDYSALFTRLLDGHGFQFHTWNVVDNELPDSPQEADAWLITGSKHGVYEDHAWISPLEKLIRQIVAAGLPLVGICFGHQIVAQALGGKVEKFQGGWAIGRHSYDLDGTQLHLNAWHQDQVVTRPEGARVLASNDFCENAMLAYGDHILTIQPHPEFTAQEIQSLLEQRAPGVVPEPLIKGATAQLPNPVDNPSVSLKMASVLKGEKI